MNPHTWRFQWKWDGKRNMMKCLKILRKQRRLSYLVTGAWRSAQSERSIRKFPLSAQTDWTEISSTLHPLLHLLLLLLLLGLLESLYSLQPPLAALWWGKPLSHTHTHTHTHTVEEGEEEKGAGCSASCWSVTGSTGRAESRTDGDMSRINAPCTKLCSNIWGFKKRIIISVSLQTSLQPCWETMTLNILSTYYTCIT